MSGLCVTGRRDGRTEEEEGGADTELKTKTPHVNVGNDETHQFCLARSGLSLSTRVWTDLMCRLAQTLYTTQTFGCVKRLRDFRNATPSGGV